METITQKQFQQPVNEPTPSIVKFVNFSDEDFTWTYNKIPYTFKVGAVKFMEAGLAEHFAKHLINRELLKRGRESDTSPKVPRENPFYMELYRKCCSPVESDGPTDQTKLENEAIDRNMKEKLGIKDEAPAPAPVASALPTAKKDEEFEIVESPDDADDSQ